MTQNDDFADRDHVDLSKNSSPDSSSADNVGTSNGSAGQGYDPAPPGPYHRYPATPGLPEVGADYWQPYDPGSDPLAGLDPIYPAYPGAYPSNPYPATYSPNPYLMAPRRTNSMANGALICSLVAIPGMFFCFAGALIAPIGVVLGIIGLNQIKERPYETGEGQAWSAIILGGLLTALCVAMVALWVVIAGS